MAIDKPKTTAEELLKASGVRAEKFKDRQKLLSAVLDEIGELTDEEWGELSPKAQAWYNTNCDLNDAKKALVDFEPASKPSVSSAVQEKRPEKTKAPVPPKAPVKPPVKPANAPPSKTKAAAPGRGGAARDIQRLSLKHPGLTAEELHGKVKSKGHDVSYAVVSSIRSHFRQAVEVLREAGELKHKDLEV